MTQAALASLVLRTVLPAPRELRTLQQRYDVAALHPPALRDRILDIVQLPRQLFLLVNGGDSCHLFPLFRLRELLLEPGGHDLLNLIVGLTPLAPHMACTRNDPDVLWAPMLQEQIDITDRMLIVLLAIDTKQRRAGLVD